jgi:hypothetical protein
MKFDESLAIGGLGQMIEDQYGKYGHFTEDSAQTVLHVIKLEPVVTPAVLMFTWMNEATFDLRPAPQINHNPQHLYGFDIGPMQMNMGLTYKSIWVGEYSQKGLNYWDVFGLDFEEGKPFDGDPIANMRMGARKLAAIHGDDARKVTMYAGPDHRQRRAENWSKYGQLLAGFYASYQN